MSEVLYEQYKDALRRGHVAALRGRLDAARGRLSRGRPDRAGSGAAVRRARRRPGAARARSTRRSPPTERRSTGRPTTRARCAAEPTSWPPSDGAPRPPRRSTGWPASSSATAGLADACDVARRALELAESRGRRRQVESLVARLRTAAPERRRGGRGPRTRARRPGVGARRRRRRRPRRPPTGDGADATAAPPGEAAAAARSEPADPRASRRRSRRATSTRPAGGRSSRAVGHRAVGQFHAAIDACYQALAIAARRTRTSTAARRALPRSRLARAGGGQAGAARAAGAADRRRRDAGAAVLPGRRPLPRRPAPRGGLRLTRTPDRA